MQINSILKDAFDVQITELTSDMSDMASLIDNAKDKFSEHVKGSEERLTQFMEKIIARPRQSQQGTYASAINNMCVTTSIHQTSGRQSVSSRVH